MNICIFSKSLPIHITGGMENHVNDLTNGLIDRGHKVTIITTKHPTSTKMECKGNLNIYYVGDRSLKYSKTFFKESANLFTRLNLDERFDLVHSQSSAAVGYVKYADKTCPLIITDHGTIINEIKTKLRSPDLKSLLIGIYLIIKVYLLDYHIFNNKKILKDADKIIAVSNELKEDIKNQYKLPDNKLVVIPNGVDISRFRPRDIGELKDNLNLAPGKIILSIGKVEEEKGFGLILKALPQIKKFHRITLIIGGIGSYLDELKNLAEDLNIKNDVIFAGKIPGEYLADYYNLADIFVFPTMRIEGLPYVIPEAMACGKPVISSNIGGIPTVIENEIDGILIEPGNLDELARKILYLLDDQDVAAKLGKAGREKIINKFSLDKMVEDTIKVYDDVLKNH